MSINANTVKSNDINVVSSAPNYNDINLINAPQQYDGVLISGGNTSSSGLLYVIWDLGSIQTVQTVICYTDTNWGFDLSNDGVTWFLIGAPSKSPGSLQTVSTSARYVRFKTGSAGVHHIYETQITVGGSIVNGPGSPVTTTGTTQVFLF